MGIWSRLTSALGGRRQSEPRLALPAPSAAPAAPGPSSERPKRGPAAGRQVKQSREQWVEHPGLGLVPQRLVRIFRAAEMGFLAEQCALFDDQIEADGHIRSLFESVERAVDGKPMVIQADDAKPESVLAQEVLWAALNRLPDDCGLSAMVRHQVRRYRYGYALTEVEWSVIEQDGREWIVPTGLFAVEPRRFRLDRKTGEFLLLTEDLAVTGEALLPGKWLVGRAAVTDIARAGKMRTGSRNCLLKSAAITNWAVYGNKFGIPLALVKYDDTDGGGENSRKNAEEIANSIGTDASAAVPKSVEVDIVEAGRMGDSTPLHSGMIGYANNENSKLVVGGTLTNDSSGSSSQSQGAGSSHALGKVHENSRWSIVVAAASDVQETFYELARLFVEFNGLVGKAAPPRLQIQVARDWTPAAIVDAAGKMVNELGIPVSKAQLYAGTGFAAPEGDEDATPGRAKNETPPPAQPAQEGTP